MRSANIYRIAVMAAIIAGEVAPGEQAGASTEPLVEPLAVEQHCVVEVAGVENGVFVTQPEVCFAVEADAAAHAASIGAGPGTDKLTRSSGNNTIGIHYTSTYYSGSSVRVVGTTCGGGVWYPHRSVEQQHRVVAPLLRDLPHHLLQLLQLHRTAEAHLPVRVHSGLDEQPGLVRALRLAR